MYVEDGSPGFLDPEPLPNDNQDVPYFFVSDNAFALRPDMMKPYSLRSLAVRLACALHARAIRSAR